MPSLGMSPSQNLNVFTHPEALKIPSLKGLYEGGMIWIWLIKSLTNQLNL